MDGKWLREQFRKNPSKRKIHLAKALSLEPPAVSKILCGTREIKAREYHIMREFFGLSTIDLTADRYNPHATILAEGIYSQNFRPHLTAESLGIVGENAKPKRKSAQKPLPSSVNLPAKDFIFNVKFLQTELHSVQLHPENSFFMHAVRFDYHQFVTGDILLFRVLSTDFKDYEYYILNTALSNRNAEQEIIHRDALCAEDVIVGCVIGKVDFSAGYLK